MFDIGWSELLIIGVITLIVVGPKDLPVVLRTIGRYLGMIRRQAADFRAQFDEAMRETEFDQIRKDMDGIRQDVSSTVRDAGRKLERDLDPDLKDASAKATLEDKVGLDAKSAANGSARKDAGGARRPFEDDDDDDDDDDFDMDAYDAQGEFDVDAWNRKVLDEEKRAAPVDSKTAETRADNTKSGDTATGDTKKQGEAPAPTRSAVKPAEKSGV